MYQPQAADNCNNLVEYCIKSHFLLSDGGSGGHLVIRSVINSRIKINKQKVKRSEKATSIVDLVESGENGKCPRPLYPESPLRREKGIIYSTFKTLTKRPPRDSVCLHSIHLPTPKKTGPY